LDECASSRYVQPTAEGNPHMTTAFDKAAFDKAAFDKAAFDKAAFDKAKTLQALHAGRSAFLIPNAWDAGSARLLTGAGFSALATTSAGFAFSRGEPDGRPGRDAILENAAAIVAATPLPVSADLEDGYGDAPEAVAETIRRALALGLAGGSIEDATGRGGQRIFDIAHAADRIRAAAAFLRAQRIPFQLVARAENFLYGRPDLADMIKRLQAYQEAGADMLYAPGLATAEQIRTVLREIDRPLNVVMGLVPSDLTVEDLEALGVARISIGSASIRFAYGAVLEAAKEMREHGTFGFARRAVPFGPLNADFARATAAPPMPAPPAWPTDPIAAVTHADPYPYYARLAATRPFYRDADLGLWVAASAAAVEAVLASEICRVRPAAEPVPKAIVGTPAGAIFSRLVRFNDGDGHCPFKHAISATLSLLDPARIAAAARERAAALIADLQPQRDLGALNRFALTLPVQVMAGLLGLEPAHCIDVPEWIRSLAGAFSPLADGPAIERGNAAAATLLDLVGALPADTLFGTLIQQTQAFGAASRDVVIANGAGLLFQSYEATAGLIGNTLLMLSKHADIRRTVDATPALIRNLVEDVLLLDPPTHNTRRFVAEDGIVAGEALRAGDAILVLLAAAGRESSGIGADDRPDLSGTARRLLTFSAGRHACPADRMAPLIAEVAVGALLQAGAVPPDTVSWSYRRAPNVRVPIFGTAT
jgi:2-methylisocitrate lyase-like PEP mutase family enzyme